MCAAAYVAFGWNTETVYDHHGRLAQAFASGRWWLVDPPSWLDGLVPCGEERWCVPYPPLPAALALPLLPIGAGLAQSLVARIAGGASAGFLFLGLRAFGAPRWVALAGAGLSAFATTLLFSSADGRSPYASHAVAMLFASLAFWLAARGDRGLLLGAAIGLAALARLPLAAAAPALALLAARKSGARYLPTLGAVIVGGVPFALAYLGYDLLRWGSVFDLGYARLAEGDVFFPYGLFSPAYVPRHLYAIFLEPPDLVEGTPWFLRPRTVGMALFLTTPALLWAFAGLREIRRDAALAATALAAALALGPDLLFGSVGGRQFGYRYSLDAQAFLIALAVTGDARAGGVWRRRPSALFLIAVALGVVVNVYAAIAVLRFGYWQ